MRISAPSSRCLELGFGTTGPEFTQETSSDSQALVMRKVNNKLSRMHWPYAELRRKPNPLGHTRFDQPFLAGQLEIRRGPE